MVSLLRRRPTALCSVFHISFFQQIASEKCIVFVVASARSLLISQLLKYACLKFSIYVGGKENTLLYPGYTSAILVFGLNLCGLFSCFLAMGVSGVCDG